MAVYQITYRLDSPRQDYDDLYEAIETLGDSVHEENIGWFVDSSKSASDIRDELKQYISSNDYLLVMKKTSSGGSWATTFSNETTDWLHDH